MANSGSSSGTTKDINKVLNGGLDAHEAMGGHMTDRHVGKTEQELLNRLNTDLNISGSSSFSDKKTAEKVCYDILSDKSNSSKVSDWLSGKIKGNKLVFNYTGNKGDVLGIGVTRGNNAARDLIDGLIVLKKDGQGGYYILTGYPK